MATVVGKSGYPKAHKANLTDAEVATLSNIVKELQGHRNPTGPAIALLKILDNNPTMAVRALRTA